MKRNFLMMAFVSLFTVVAISSCNKDDDDDGKEGGNIDNTITATVEHGNSYNGKIDSVKAKIYPPKKNSYLVTLVAASTNYSNGGFTLKLPETVSDTYLSAFDDDNFYVDNGITISNRNVKISQTYIEAYKANDVVGEFYYGTADWYWYGRPTYSNGDVSITGSMTEEHNSDGDGDGVDETHTYTTKFNIHLKKGWNMVYGKEGEYEEEYTTTAPSGAKWYYEDYYESDTSSQLKKVPFLSSKRR
ncbi:MAG: hypothetical protein LBS55_12375 [Prevotellaceae bacterium]|jgi:hypothetical protein|nr:hypothetical protein [Prevotellaceae bacterium]